MKRTINYNFEVWKLKLYSLAVHHIFMGFIVTLDECLLDHLSNASERRMRGLR